MCQVSAKSKNRFFYVEFFCKLVGNHEKKPKNPKFSTSKSIFKPIRKFSRLTVIMDFVILPDFSEKLIFLNFEFTRENFLMGLKIDFDI